MNRLDISPGQDGNSLRSQMAQHEAQEPVLISGQEGEDEHTQATSDRIKLTSKVSTHYLHVC